MEPLISVIVPVYKVEQYLGRCVESLLAQTYENIEIILVDDGSPDSCPQLCDGYAEKYEKIRVIHQENKGLSGARNTGINSAKGELLAFVDSDDKWSPYFLESLYRALKEHDADISQCRWEYIHGDEILEAYDAQAKYECFTGREMLANLYIQTGAYYVVAWNKLYKKELFEVLKFVDILYDKMAIVNRSDVMYFGYILRDNNTYQDILTTFDNTSYRLYNISNVIQANSRIHKNVVTVIKYVIIAILFILILFSIYLGYLEYKYQEDSLRKLKYLGCSFDKWIKPAIIKLIISIMICLICGFIWTSIILHYIDIILIYFHTIFHISFNYKIILISSLFSMICLIIGFISACYHFKKL